VSSRPSCLDNPDSNAQGDVDRFNRLANAVCSGCQATNPPMRAKRRSHAPSDNKMGDTDEKIFIGKGDEAGPG